jgi:hypothetical protein
MADTVKRLVFSVWTSELAQDSKLGETVVCFNQLVDETTQQFRFVDTPLSKHTFRRSNTRQTATWSTSHDHSLFRAHLPSPLSSRLHSSISSKPIGDSEDRQLTCSLTYYPIVM